MIHSDSDFATVAYLRVKNANLESKRDVAAINPAVPPVVEEDFETVRTAGEESLASSESRSLTPDYAPDDAVLYFVTSSKSVGPWVSVTDVHRSMLVSHPSQPPIEDEVNECFHVLQGTRSISASHLCAHVCPDQLKKYSLDVSHCANINIFISSMDLFARVNAVYTTFFGSSPPARACVAADLPAGLRVKLDCIAYSETQPVERQALHVQGLSYWAPANIGPYSQAITVRGDRVV